MDGRACRAAGRRRTRGPCGVWGLCRLGLRFTFFAPDGEGPLGTGGRREGPGGREELGEVPGGVGKMGEVPGGGGEVPQGGEEVLCGAGAGQVFLVLNGQTGTLVGDIGIYSLLIDPPNCTATQHSKLNCMALCCPLWWHQ